GLDGDAAEDVPDRDAQVMRDRGADDDRDLWQVRHDGQEDQAAERLPKSQPRLEHIRRVGELGAREPDRRSGGQEDDEQRGYRQRIHAGRGGEYATLTVLLYHGPIRPGAAIASDQARLAGKRAAVSPDCCMTGAMAMMGARILGGRYALLEELGAGGMAMVYRARDEVLGREVAVKVLSPQFAADPGFLARFEREARHVAAISHPRIVTVFDSAIDPN